MSLTEKLKDKIRLGKEGSEEKIHTNAVIIQTHILRGPALGCLAIGDVNGYDEVTERLSDALVNRKYTSHLVLDIAKSLYLENRSISARLKDSFYRVLDYCFD